MDVPDSSQDATLTGQTSRVARSTVIPLLAILTLLAMIAFLKVAKVIILPVVLSAFLALLLSPLILWLKKREWPVLPAALASLASVFALIILVGLLGVLSLQTLGSALPDYLLKMQVLMQKFSAWLPSLGFNMEIEQVMDMVDGGYIAVVLSRSLAFALDLTKYGVMIFFLTLFMLIEAARFKSKLARAFGEDNWINSALASVGIEIQRYILFKTLISLATGILVWGWLELLHVDFALLWGLITFLLNFIPSVGSIVASVPPVLVALVQFGNPVEMALIVLAGELAIQVTIGNYLDPRIMGRNLNLSALIIFVSMMFWGWLWGPVGMLVAVPLAVCIKVSLSHHDQTRALSLMMES